MADIVVGDTFKIIEIDLGCDLTDCSAYASYRIGRHGTLKTKDPLAIYDAINGKVRFMTRIASDFDRAGYAEGRVYINSGPLIGKTFKFRIEVEADTV
jgi:hypothetical protein